MEAAYLTVLTGVFVVLGAGATRFAVRLVQGSSPSARAVAIVAVRAGRSDRPVTDR